MRGGHDVLAEGQDKQGRLRLPIVIDAERTSLSNRAPEVRRIPPLGRRREGETVEPSGGAALVGTRALVTPSLHRGRRSQER